MYKTNMLTILLFFIFKLAFTQELPLLTDKKGTFKILERSDYTKAECHYTTSEIAENLQQIKKLVKELCKNPILSELAGFDGQARIYTVPSCNSTHAYGIPARISLEFMAWYQTKEGKEQCSRIEPPEWSVHINFLQPGWSSGFTKNPLYFAIPIKKQTIAPGIDVYDDEYIVLYRPEKPDYWLPVTLKEAFDASCAEIKSTSDDVQWRYSKEMLDAEWAAFPTSDWEKPATLSGMLSRTGILEAYPKIVQINPLYWDTTRGKGDIQFITLRISTNKRFLNQRTQEYLKANSTSYPLALFEESLDFETVISLWKSFFEK